MCLAAKKSLRSPETGSAVFGTALLRKNDSKRKICAQRSSPGVGDMMLDPSHGRVRSEDRKQTRDFG